MATSPTTTSCPPLLFPMAENCTGKGVCDSEFSCTCTEPGWTTFGDMAFRGQASCAINMTVIQILWGISGVIHLFLVFFVLYFARRRVVRVKRTAVTVGICICVVLFNVSLCSVAFLRVSNPAVHVIGTHPATTVLFSMGTASFWSAVHFFTYEFFALAFKQAKFSAVKSETILFRMRTQFPLTAMGAVVASMLPIGLLASQDDPVQFQRIVSSHYILSGVLLVMTGLVLVRKAVRDVSQEIKTLLDLGPSSTGMVSHTGGSSAVGIKQQEVKVLVDKMQWFNRELGNQAFGNFVIALFFGLWPYLQIYGSSYFLPLAWLSGAFVEAVALYVLLPVTKRETDGSKGASSIEKNSKGGLVSYRGGNKQQNTATVASSYQGDPHQQDEPSTVG